MIAAAGDPSLKWAEACDRLRRHIVGLPTAAGCFIFPSVEAALTEIAVLLADREREIGGERNIIIYASGQDPAIDRMAKTISSTGLDAKPKTAADWLQISTWLPDLKSKAILVAHAEDDRFTGRVHDTTMIESALFKEGMRVPVVTLCFGSGPDATEAWQLKLPRPYEIRVYPLAKSSGAAVATVGERLRLEPRIAPLSMGSLHLELNPLRITDLSAVLPETRESESGRARYEVESFEAALPKPFQSWWPKGASRMLDRAIITSKEHDGSRVVELLRAQLSKQKSVTEQMLDEGLFSLSGCAMNDERRQEWLRSRGDDAWLIRGGVHISRQLVNAISREAWIEAFKRVQ